MNITPGRPHIDMIVPVFNEADGIQQTYSRLTSVIHKMNLSGSIIFIDDGSTDSTWQILKNIALNDHRVKLIRFSRNFGHQAAILAGLAHSSADYNLILDADLQDPPELLEQMLPLALKGYDVVYGVRETRAGETTMKKTTAGLFYRVINLFSAYKIPLDAGDFRLVSAQARSLFLKAHDKARLNREIWSWIGLSQIPIIYHRPARAFGKSKYNWLKMLKLAFDGLTGVGVGPILLTGAAAVLLWVVGFFMLFTAGSLVCAITFVAAVLQTALAIVGFYVARLYGQARRRPTYLKI
jgi:dolichol-phosphate mannosyltransferase